MNELPITGYATDLAIAPGQWVGFAVSTQADSYTARLVRLHRELELLEHVASTLDGRYPGRYQAIVPGSFARLTSAAQPWPVDLTIRLNIMPTRIAEERQGIVTFGPDCGIFIANGIVQARCGAGAIDAQYALAINRWYEVVFRVDDDGHKLSLSVVEQSFPAEHRAVEIDGGWDRFDPNELRLSGWTANGAQAGCLDGKISGPRVLSATRGLLADWDFSRDHHTSYVRDRSEFGHDLTLSQTPRRAVTGPRWRGEQDPARAPWAYEAIAFHSDDLTDAGWAMDFSWQIPADLPSGAYAVVLNCDDGTDHIPFFVTAAPTPSRSRAAFLVPTFSYLAYANEFHWWEMPDIEARTGKPLEDCLSPGERWAHAKGLLSCYDRHRDGTGCTHSSWRRPILNMRAGYRHPYIPGPHQLSADLYILDWLASLDLAVDIVTDHDLHVHGIAALDGYALVMTGSHPEYASENLLNALIAFRARGGNLMYLGGNGFYNVVTTYSLAPHVMELRRGHSGGVHWKSPLGEAYHAGTGEFGGKWMLRARSAHVLFGEGTSSVSFDRGQPFVRTEESRDPAVSWIFEGVSSDVIDTDSIVLGQPAGFEYDRMESWLGTPKHAVRLASAQFEPAVTMYTIEEAFWAGQVGKNRADLVFVGGSEGAGDVFSVGSIAWTGCLFTPGENKVATITENVVRRFLTTPPVIAAELACQP